MWHRVMIRKFSSRSKLAYHLCSRCISMLPRSTSRHVLHRLYSRDQQSSSTSLVNRVLRCGLTARKQPLSSYTEKKRFYEHADILEGEGGYQITLDNKKVKTPAGHPLIVPNKHLAVSVAVEWNSQKENIEPNNMHLTGLCNTVIDNPKSVSSEDTINQMLDFLHTDTVCFLADTPDDLIELQTREWGPLLKWFNERFDVPLQFNQGFLADFISDENEQKVRSHMMSFNHWSLTGMEYAVDTTKSLVISLALVDRYLSVERAVYLSRLELEYQISRWGSVEWAHDVDLMELRSRLAAATLFCHLNM